MINSLSSRNIGAWCNGNTWVSKTFVEGSSPSAPAKSSPSIGYNLGEDLFLS